MYSLSRHQDPHQLVRASYAQRHFQGFHRHWLISRKYFCQESSGGPAQQLTLVKLALLMVALGDTHVKRYQTSPRPTHSETLLKQIVKCDRLNAKDAATLVQFILITVGRHSAQSTILSWQDHKCLHTEQHDTARYDMTCVCVAFNLSKSTTVDNVLITSATTFL